MPLPWTARIVSQLCDVLAEAHDKKIIHRDLKPSNLMLLAGRPPGREHLKVLDFGLSKILVDTERNITKDGFVGTVAYASPEQARGEAVDARSDLYSVGVLLYEFLSGVRPFVGPVLQQFHDVIHTTPQRPSDLNPMIEVPEALEDLVMTCLAKDPAERPQSARALAEALESALTVPTVILPARPPSAPSRSRLRPQVPPAVPAKVAAPPAPPPDSKPASSPVLKRITSIRAWVTRGQRSVQRAPDPSNAPGLIVPARAGESICLVFPGEILNVNVTTGGLDVLVATREDAARVVSLETGRERHRVQLPGPFASVQLAPDGRFALCGGLGAALVLDAATGQELVKFQGHTDWVVGLSALWEHHLMLTGDTQGDVRLWDARTGMELRRLAGHEQGVWALTFGDQGRMAVTGGVDRTVRLWDLATGDCPRSVVAHESEVGAVVSLPGVGLALSAGLDHMIYLWDLVRGERVRAFAGHQSEVTCLALASNPRVLASGDGDGVIRLWDVQRGVELKCLERHDGPVTGLSWFPGNLQFASGGKDGTVRVWDTPEDLVWMLAFTEGNPAVAGEVPGAHATKPAGGRSKRGLRWLGRRS
jgi:WD40 repeat protein